MASNGSTGGAATQQADPLQGGMQAAQQPQQGYVNPNVLKFAAANPGSVQAQKYPNAAATLQQQQQEAQQRMMATTVKPTDYFDPQTLGRALDNPDDWQTNQQISSVLGSGWRDAPGVIPTAQGWAFDPRASRLSPQSMQTFVNNMNWNSQLSGSPGSQNMARMAAAQGYQQGSAFAGMPQLAPLPQTPVDAIRAKMIGGQGNAQPSQQAPRPQGNPMGVGGNIGGITSGMAGGVPGVGTGPQAPTTGPQSQFQQNAYNQNFSQPPQYQPPQYQPMPMWGGQPQAPMAMPWMSGGYGGGQQMWGSNPYLQFALAQMMMQRPYR